MLKLAILLVSQFLRLHPPTSICQTEFHKMVPKAQFYNGMFISFQGKRINVLYQFEMHQSEGHSKIMV